MTVDQEFVFVTATSPKLRVKRATATNDEPALHNSTLYASPTIGDKVVALLVSNQVVVLGKFA